MGWITRRGDPWRVRKGNQRSTLKLTSTYSHFPAQSFMHFTLVRYVSTPSVKQSVPVSLCTQHSVLVSVCTRVVCCSRSDSVRSRDPSVTYVGGAVGIAVSSPPYGVHFGVHFASLVPTSLPPFSTFYLTTRLGLRSGSEPSGYDTYTPLSVLT